MKTLYAVILGAALVMGLGGCGTTDEIRKMPTSTTLPTQVQEVQRNIRVGHTEIAKLAAVIGSHKASGLLEASKADKLLDNLDDIRAELVEARKLILAGELISAQDKAKLQQLLIQKLAEEVAKEVAKRKETR